MVRIALISALALTLFSLPAAALEEAAARQLRELAADALKTVKNDEPSTTDGTVVGSVRPAAGTIAAPPVKHVARAKQKGARSARVAQSRAATRRRPLAVPRPVVLPRLRDDAEITRYRDGYRVKPVARSEVAAEVARSVASRTAQLELDDAAVATLSFEPSAGRSPLMCVLPPPWHDSRSATVLKSSDLGVVEVVTGPDGDIRSIAAPLATLAPTSMRMARYIEEVLIMDATVFYKINGLVAKSGK